MVPETLLPQKTTMEQNNCMELQRHIWERQRMISPDEMYHVYMHLEGLAAARARAGARASACDDLVEPADSHDLLEEPKLRNKRLQVIKHKHRKSLCAGPGKAAQRAAKRPQP